MNKSRRAEIEAAITLIEQAMALLDNAASGERDYCDAMPESLQGSERGQRSDEAAGALEDAAATLGEVINQAQAAMT